MSDLDFGRRPGIPAEDDATGDAAFDAAVVPPRSPMADPTARRGEDELDRSLRPKVLDDFVGQKRVREQLRVFIDAAKQRDEALDHALFAGPPGLGKCVTPDTLLTTTHGMVPIGTLGDLQGESWQPITRPMAGLYGTKTADYFYNNGESDTLRVTTASGYRVEGTPNHPVLVRGGDRRLQFRRLSELATGDEVAVRLGAQLFGSSTKLHVEGIKAPSLTDPAVVPEELTEDLARLLGLMLGAGKLSPGGDGVVLVTGDAGRAEALHALFTDVFCLQLETFGEGPFGMRYGVRSPRVAALLTALGLERQGFKELPQCIYRAPKLLVAEFLRGVFFGVEHAPQFQARERAIVAHLQLLLANFGIESELAPSANGFQVRASVEPARYESIDAANAAIGSFAGREAPTSVPESAGAHEPAGVADHTGDDAGPMDFWQEPEIAADPAAAAEEFSAALSDVGEVGFGITAAGVLVAMGSSSDPTEGYRRGSARSSDISRVLVAAGGVVDHGTTFASGGSAVSVAEVEPAERGRALTRERLHDTRALAVRSVRSPLRQDEIVELIWEPVASIEPGHAHTCDVSVPDGHTFIGNGIVCHNTTLASVVANELGSTMHQTSGPALEKKADVAAILTALQPKDVLFIDEIHRLNTAIEEVLYSAMEDYQIDIVLGQGPAARTLRLDVEPFTLVGATTRAGLLTTPLRDRFGLVQRLEYYDHDELQQIVERSARLLGLKIDPAAAAEIATRSRGTPRIANRLLKRVRDVAQVRHSGDVTIDVAQEALDLVDIDAVGLDRLDRAILETILVKFSGGPVGLSTLSVSLGEEAHTIEDVYEPFLLQRGFIQRTPRGRVITEHGRAHLGERGVTAPAAPGLASGGLF